MIDGHCKIITYRPGTKDKFKFTGGPRWSVRRRV